MSDFFENFKKEQLERLKSSKWHKKDYYHDEQALLNTIKENKYKVGRQTKTIGQIKELLSNEESFVSFSACDDKLIPFGRSNTYINRDYIFFQNTKNALKNLEPKNALFINYTGHCGPVGAALKSKNIPLIWNLKLDEDALAEKRIIEQIQDYYNELSTPENHEICNLGLMLESPHGDFETFEVSKLLTSSQLKQKQIKKIYIFVEEPADKPIMLADCNFYNDAFSNYAKLLSNDFEIKIIPIDEKTTKQKLAPKKEFINNPKIYYSNLNCN